MVQQQEMSMLQPFFQCFVQLGVYCPEKSEKLSNCILTKKELNSVLRRWLDQIKNFNETLMTNVVLTVTEIRLTVGIVKIECTRRIFRNVSIPLQI